MPASKDLPICIIHRKGEFFVSQNGYRGRKRDQYGDYQLIGDTPRRLFEVNGKSCTKLEFASSHDLMYWLGECESKGLRLEPAFNLQHFGVAAG